MFPKSIKMIIGLEFLNSSVQRVLDKYGVQLRTTRAAGFHATMAESAIRRLKSRLYRIMANNQNHVWAKYLPAVCRALSAEPLQRLHHLPPAAVSIYNEHLFLQLQKHRLTKKSPTKPLFSIGDTVRCLLSKRENVFHKGYEQAYTDEVYIISGRKWRPGGNWWYTLKTIGPDSQPVAGSFSQLQLTAAPANEK